MIKPVLSEDILLSLEKCARYIGNEVNSVVKDPDQVDIRFAMCFPDVYEIGMSNLGIQILYEMFNKRPDTWCERLFSPWPDLVKILKEKNIPLFALESQSPICEFDFLGISLQYEMCYTNILSILDLSGIPIYSKDRKNSDTIVIAGGPCTYNPEPVADFFDIVYIGEGEVSYDELLDLYKRHKNSGFNREKFLIEAAGIPGLYVPLLYETKYNDDLTLSEFTPVFPDIPSQIKRQIDLNFEHTHAPLRPVIPHIRATQDRMVLEIQRGCIRGCRFCQAGIIYRPNREKDMDVLKSDALSLIENTGYEEISLSSLSSSDYKHLPEYLDFLMEECGNRKINISLPSLRIDSVSIDTMKKIGDVRKTSVTFAPEAGSQRMRDVINKGITYDNIINGARLAYEGGFRNIKLYFMLGLPGEREEDILSIADIAEDLVMLFYDTIPKPERISPAHITVSTSFFVPKPFTPFQWESMETIQSYKDKAHMLKTAIKEKVHSRHISYQWHDPDVTILEGVFARGDRRVSRVIKRAYDLGAQFDAWSEFFSYDIWLQAFEDEGISPYDYTKGSTDIKARLPWDFIDVGVSRHFLEKERELSKKAAVTPDCKSECSYCGCKKYNCGVCNEH